MLSCLALHAWGLAFVNEILVLKILVLGPIFLNNFVPLKILVLIILLFPVSSVPNFLKMLIPLENIGPAKILVFCFTIRLLTCI